MTPGRLLTMALSFTQPALAMAPEPPWPVVSEGRIERLPLLAPKPVDPRPVDLGLPADDAPCQAFVNEIVRERGDGTADSALRVFKGSGHHERVWGPRVHLAIECLPGGR